MFRYVRMLAACCAFVAAQPTTSAPEMLRLEGDVDGVHDPVIMREGGSYYVFSTDRRSVGRIPIRSSTDLRRWSLRGYVFPALPEWAAREIPGARGVWAPDISRFHGRYHLYYSLSTFGSRNSAIGLATNKTLDPDSKEYKWVDEGLVLRSHQEHDDWNAIDPNLVIENEHSVWLTWGSFWSGIKMRRIDPVTGKLSTADTTMYSLASRPRVKPVDGSIEAPFIFRHGGQWYLFASFDFCCRGAKSTYRIAVGRSKRVTGPYVDRAGVAMTEGGGTTVLEATTPNWRGPGHQAVLRDSGRDYLVFHAYEGTTGQPRLHIATIDWDDGWPRTAQLP